MRRPALLRRAALLACSRARARVRAVNAGSAGGAGALAGQALSTTQVATGAAGMSWMLTEWALKGKPTVMSVISGAVAGLVAITPACGYVDHNGAIIMGFIVGIICSQSIRLKHYFGYDDALDAFGVHGVGGVIGALLTGLFASPHLNNFYPGCPIKNEPCGGPFTQIVSGAFYDHTLPAQYGATNRHGIQLGFQFYGVTVVAGWSTFCTYIILKVIDKIMGLRVDIKDEVEGLDASVHGETVRARARRVRSGGARCCVLTCGRALQGVLRLGGHEAARRHDAGVALDACAARLLGGVFTTGFVRSGDSFTAICAGRCTRRGTCAARAAPGHAACLFYVLSAMASVAAPIRSV